MASLLDQDDQEELAASFSTATPLNAIHAGARGYLLKGADPNDVLSVIGAVTEGQALISLAIAMQLMNYFREMSLKPLSFQGKSPFLN